MEKTRRKKRILALLGLGAVVLLWVVLLYLVGKPMLQFAEEPERFRDWVEQYGIWGKVLFTAMVVLQVVVAIIPGEPLEIVAGYAFGVWAGSLLCMIGFIVGSVLIYLLVKRFGKPLLNLFFSEEKISSLWFLKDSPKRNTLLFVLMLLPGTPKDLISYFVGLTGIRLPIWIGTVFVTRIPSLVTSTVGGDALGMQNYTFAILTFLAVGVISAGGMLGYRAICRFHEKRKERSENSRKQ